MDSSNRPSLNFRIDPTDHTRVTAIAEDPAATVEVELDIEQLRAAFATLLGTTYRRKIQPPELDALVKEIVFKHFMDVTNAAMAGRHFCDAIAGINPAEVEQHGRFIVKTILETMEYKVWPSDQPFPST